MEEDPNIKGARAGRRARRSTAENANEEVTTSIPEMKAFTEPDPSSPLAQGGTTLSPSASLQQPTFSRRTPPPADMAPTTKAFASSANTPLADQLSDDGSSSKKFTGVSRRKMEQLEQNDESAKIRAKYDEVSRETEILDLQELEEQGREDLSAVVADAPKVRVNRVQDLGELDADMQVRLPPSSDRDIDLSLLTGVLCASEQVQEGDELWETEQLLQDVASQLTIEREKTEGTEVDKDGGEQGPMMALEGKVPGQGRPTFAAL